MAAKDALGDDVKASAWLEKHQPGDRSLTQGLKSDATYLIGKSFLLESIIAYCHKAACSRLSLLATVL